MSPMACDDWLEREEFVAVGSLNDLDTSLP